MAKKRKQRSSEPVSSTQPQSQPQPQPQPQQEQPLGEEEEQSQPQPIQEEEEEGEEEEEQQQQQQDQDQQRNRKNMAVEELEEPEQQQQQQGEGIEDKQKEEQEPETLLDPQANGNGNEEHQEEEEQEDLDEEPLEKLLEPFGKDQLLVLLKRAVDKYPDLMDSVREIADADPAHRKIFVHGLGWDTTADTLISEFGKYGEIEDCKAVTDRVSGKSKGYAFILFKHRIGARNALQQPQKKIGNRITSCQLATAGPVPAPPPTVHLPPPVSEYTQRKIFVSNVSAEIDPEKLLHFFRQFGEIEDGPLGLDKQTGKPKGFALFVYKSIESAKKALEEPHKNFEGHTLHCQKAIDGPKPGKQGFGGPGGGAHHQQQHHHPHHHHQQHYHHAAKKGKYSGGPGHLMAPSGPPVSFNPGMTTQGLNPALGQALTALIATQGAGLGLGNLLGGLGGAPVNQGGPPAGYGNQATAGYGNQPGMQGGYPNPQMGQGGAGRSQQGGAPYMGH